MRYTECKKGNRKSFNRKSRKMESFEESKLLEQITIYESKIKAIKDQIADELRTRRDLKEKVREAKRREATEILILERLDEYQKIVNQQIEAAAKMEDCQSVKRIAVIEKYENMLREQQEIWAKYEAEFEDLPLAKDRRASSSRLQNATIQNKLIFYKIEDTKRTMTMKHQINKRLEQLKIIELAKMYVEHKKKEICCSNLTNEVKSLKVQEKELRLEVQRLETQASETKKRDFLVTKSSMLSKQLPKVDLSAYIIARDKRNDAFDNQSINSYKLEQEYVNSDIYMRQSSSQPTSNALMELNTGEDRTNDSMDIDDDDYVNQNELRESATILSASPKKQNPYQRINVGSQEQHADRENHINNDKQDTRMNLKNAFKIEEKKVHEYGKRGVHEVAYKDKDLKETQQQQLRNSDEAYNNGRTNGNSEKYSQRNPPELLQINDGNRCKRRGNQSRQQNKVDVELEVNRLSSLERPIPTPTKMAKSIPVQQQSDSLSAEIHRNSEQSNFNRNLSKVPQSKKPYVKSIEHVNYQNGQTELMIETTKSAVQAMTSLPKESMMCVSPISNFDSTVQQHQEQQKIFKSISMDIQEALMNGSPINSLNNMFNMETPSMVSSLMDMQADANSDISMILGSEITEPGGSLELAKRFYDADSDAYSEDGFNYDKIVEKFCSPPQVKAKVELTQKQLDGNCQTKSQEQREQHFIISTQNVKKQMPTSSRFF